MMRLSSQASPFMFIETLTCSCCYLLFSINIPCHIFFQNANIKHANISLSIFYLLHVALSVSKVSLEKQEDYERHHKCKYVGGRLH